MPKPKDPFEHRDFKRYANHFIGEVAPKIRGSAFMITIAPPASGADVKLATELGYAILLDKPLIVLVPVGRGEHTAKKLLRIADHVIEADFETEEGRAAAQLQLASVLNQ